MSTVFIRRRLTSSARQLFADLSSAVFVRVSDVHDRLGSVADPNEIDKFNSAEVRSGSVAVIQRLLIFKVATTARLR